APQADSVSALLNPPQRIGQAVETAGVVLQLPDGHFAVSGVLNVIKRIGADFDGNIFTPVEGIPQFSEHLFQRALELSQLGLFHGCTHFAGPERHRNPPVVSVSPIPSGIPMPGRPILGAVLSPCRWLMSHFDVSPAHRAQVLYRRAWKWSAFYISVGAVAASAFLAHGFAAGGCGA